MGGKTKMAMSREEKISTIVSKMDRDGNGTITLKEMGAFLGVMLSSERPDDPIPDAATLEEMVGQERDLSEMVGKSCEEMKALLQEKCDDDDKLDDVLMAYGIVAGPPSAFKDKMDKVVGFIDADGDGNITMDEWSSSCKQSPAIRMRA